MGCFGATPGGCTTRKHDPPFCTLDEFDGVQITPITTSIELVAAPITPPTEAILENTASNGSSSEARNSTF